MLAPEYQRYVRILIVAAGQAIKADGKFTITNLLKQPHVAAARDDSFAYSKAKARRNKRAVADSVNGEIERRTKEAIRKVHRDLKAKGLAAATPEYLFAATVFAFSQNTITRRAVLRGAPAVAVFGVVTLTASNAQAGDDRYKVKVARDLRRFLVTMRAEIVTAIRGN